MEFFNELKEIIAAELAIDESTVVPGAHLQDDLGADSLGILNIADAIADKYKITIVADDLVDIANVGELVDMVKAKIAAIS
jgi:acyl carrier protein